MKALIISQAIILLYLVSGCTSTKIKTNPDGTWEMQRVSMFQRLDVPKITVKDQISIEGYSNDGGAEAMAKMIEAAYKAGILAAGAATTGGVVP